MIDRERVCVSARETEIVFVCVGGCEKERYNASVSEREREREIDR